MRNRFPGVCYRCGKPVPAGEGHFEKVGRPQERKFGPAVRRLKWLTQHADCAIQYYGTAHIDPAVLPTPHHRSEG